MTTFFDFILDQGVRMSKAGGEKVSEANYYDRIKVCEKCPHYGQVNPLPLVNTKGCTLCGCPSATKPKYYSFYRLPGMSGKKLTSNELKEIQTRRSKGGELELEIITCPDKENRWGEVDSNNLK